ncbi:hypothetical protein Q8F55_000254 [Vanrija albida]|uniref:SAC domain-containing protein n=1 Tax=Vanrija albida TaxID=181172 RepID=A0ABR3QCR1_9TREE
MTELLSTEVMSRDQQSEQAALSKSLPARLTVPPLPPRIHRRLDLSAVADGLLLRPAGNGPSSEAVLVRWGLRGSVEPVSPSVYDNDSAGVELGGVLGIVRLWDAAYLVVFLPQVKAPTRLFPSDDPFDTEAAAHEVHSLADVYAVPLVPDRARAQLEHFASILSKRTPKQPKTGAKGTATPSKPGIGIKWTLPWGSPKKGAAAESESESESDSDSDSENDTASELARRRASSIAPEADETPPELPPVITDSPEVRVKKRFSLGWGRFTPRLGKPRAKAAPAPKPKDGKASLEPPSRGSGESRRSSEGRRSAEGRSSADSRRSADSRLSAEVGALVPDEEFELGTIRQKAKATEASLPPPPADTSRSPTPPLDNVPQRRELETKIMKQITRELGSGEFFYSFDFDLSHTLQHKRGRLSARSASAPLLDSLLAGSAQLFEPPSPSFAKEGEVPSRPSSRASSQADSEIVEPDIHVPLWRRFDRRFFWNEWLLRDFIDGGLHAYVLPVAQGYCQSASIAIPVPPAPADDGGPPPAPIPLDLVIISRRSRDRAGLRYQRRGIDDEGHVANFVETEMLVRARVQGKASLFSFVQVRGSIPLKWSQTPWSMKPPPVLDQPVDKTFSVANLHFDDLRSRYGPVTAINLSEQKGIEAAVTNGYTELVDSLGRPDLTYIPWDFHAKCHGMKWENISELVNSLDFDSIGYLWALQGEAVQEQRGAFRTNCIDCLDRTNVVQSAIARRVLTHMMTQMGIVLDPAVVNIEPTFNDIWANNGDMISLCYAHTSALKGDFVRTGKRDLQGMLHDGVSSLSRMFYGAVTDFFAQAVISFMLGHRNLGVFNEFLENLQSTEASALIRQSRVRAAAIETSSARVLSDGEQRVAGWTLLSPEERNIALSPKLEEKVLILTKAALYVVSFNYQLEKVNEFTRIPLKSITSIQKGAYILSALQEAGRDPVENAGFIVNFSPADESTRYSTYSLRNREPPSPETAASATPISDYFASESAADADTPTAKPTPPDTPMARVKIADVDPTKTEYFAFKALPREFIAKSKSTLAVSHDDEDDEDEEDIMLESNETCRATVERVVRRIKDQCVKAGGGGGGGSDFVVDKDVVSLHDAESNTSLLARMDYAVKRFLWL